MENQPKSSLDLSAEKGNPKKNIKNWNDKRKDKSFLESYFTKAGNRFSFKPNREISDYLHIYLAMTDEGELNFYFIEENDDKQKKNDWLSKTAISPHKEPLPSNLLENSIDHAAKLPYEKVAKWVENWNDDKIRGEWIEAHFSSKSENNTIMLAFGIDSSDFVVGTKHECFLALKKVNSKYVADIVVYNTDNFKILNSQNTIDTADSSYEDLARPVPPFGGDYNDYGVLVELDIK
ncbi:hypothetical protein QYS49_38160 [Marivirga salinae]|uniref:Uncharacterized protein n=1 Tax=Marivirga salinarum TaxID=3059078 RepID=A0AA51N9L5_9BACT|nr:hypothetical protein [Marivirga sp. BDSF4-3]WMN11376.1 hypothetical protein QYS49_38160 [Marivirga sp. BDSF4-3]